MVQVKRTFRFLKSFLCLVEFIFPCYTEKYLPAFISLMLVEFY